MTLDQHVISARLIEISVGLHIEKARVVLDEGRAPYGEATLTCTLPGEEERALIDLREGDLTLDLRIQRRFGFGVPLSDITALAGPGISDVTAFLESGPLSVATNLRFRPFNGSVVRASQSRKLRLLVTERAFNDFDKTLSLRGHTFEALLLGDSLLGDAWDPGSTNLRTICEKVLLRYGATLEPGATTATVAETEATVWTPGTTAFRYLNAMLEAASLRLWSDERGVWRLAERQETTDGNVIVTATGAMTRHRDTMTRTNPDVWFDAVVVPYEWTDVAGDRQVAYDTAGAVPAKSTRTLPIRRTPYPGPGAAAGYLNRARGRGRALDVRAVSDYTVTPGQAASITPPDSPLQSGYISGVEWLAPEFEMNLSTRGLVDITDDSFLAGSDVTFADVASSAPGLAVEDFDWSLV